MGMPMMTLGQMKRAIPLLLLSRASALCNQCSNRAAPLTFQSTSLARHAAPLASNRAHTPQPLTNKDVLSVSRIYPNDGSDRFISSSALFASKEQGKTITSLSELEEEEEKNTGQSILSLALPALAGLAIDPLMTLADTAFVGRTATDSDALAGMGSAAALLTFSFYVFNFLCTATTPLVASRRASGDENGALAVGGQALSLALVLGSLLTGGLILFSSQLLNVMGTGVTGAEADEFAKSFLVIRSLAAPAVLATSAATGVLRGYLDTRTPLVILVVANIVNLALDFVLVLGGGMGPTGAAIATTTAEWICAISLLGVLAGRLPSAAGELGSNQRDRSNSDDGSLSKQNDLLSVVPSLSVPAWDSVKPLVIASSSVFLRSVVLQLALSGAAAMAARSTGIQDGGASASVAAHQIALQLWLLCSFVCDALAAASQALVADALGGDRPDIARDVGRTVVGYSLGLGLALSAALGVGTYATDFLMDFFTTDVATRNALLPLLTIVVFAQPLNSFVFAADGVLQGASQFTFQAKAMALSVWAGAASFIGLEYLGMDKGVPPGTDTLVHVWYALIFLQLMRGLTSFLRLVETGGPIELLKKT